jgi:hypothetical protein
LSRRMPPCAPRIAVALWYTSRYARTEATEHAHVRAT